MVKTPSRLVSSQTQTRQTCWQRAWCRPYASWSVHSHSTSMPSCSTRHLRTQSRRTYLPLGLHSSSSHPPCKTYFEFWLLKSAISNRRPSKWRQPKPCSTSLASGTLCSTQLTRESNTSPTSSLRLSNSSNRQLWQHLCSKTANFTKSSFLSWSSYRTHSKSEICQRRETPSLRATCQSYSTSRLQATKCPQSPLNSTRANWITFGKESSLRVSHWMCRARAG